MFYFYFSYKGKNHRFFRVSLIASWHKIGRNTCFLRIRTSYICLHQKTCRVLIKYLIGGLNIMQRAATK